MSHITKFDTAHEDLIHDIAYDFYGKRLVTCSSDQRLKVWDFVERDDANVWEQNDSWKAHDSSILKAIWAHPEYGQVIASCSLDRLVKIWEEQPIESKMSQKRWTERFRLVESRGAVLDIAFSPIQGSLRLATCSADGIVRIYEALEPTNLTQWSQMEEFEITLHDHDQALPEPSVPQHTNSTSSSGSSIASHGIATPEAGGLPVMTAVNNAAATAAAAASGAIGNVGSSGIQNVSPTSQGTMPVPPTVFHGPGDADSGYCIDWCPNRTALPMMVVGLGKEIGARIFRHDGHNRWYPGEFLPGHEQEVHDVSWAPSMARSYQLIATASKDHHVRIFKLTEPVQSAVPQRFGQFSPATGNKQRAGPRHMQIKLVAEFNDHHAEVWRVEWNITGTILSSSGDDGKVRLWKAGSDGVWRQMAAISANHHPSALPH